MENILDQIFNEEYIGKIPEFERISELFDMMLVKARKNPTTINPNKWNENKEIQKIFKKFFGLKAFHLYWIPSDVRNAWTITDSALMGGERIDAIIERQPGKGFYDTHHRCVFVIFGYIGLLLEDAKMNGRNITAIILHEIGHNLDHSPYTHLGIMRKLYLKLKKTDAVDANNAYKLSVYQTYKKEGDDLYGNQKQRDKDRERDEAALKAYVNSSALHKFILGTCNNLMNVITVASGFFYLFFQFMVLKMRKGEQFADSFATTYGFGPDLLQALTNFSDHKNLILRNHKSDIFMRDYLDAAIEIQAVLGDEHSSNQTRCKDCILKLKDDLNKGDYPPDMKADLMEEIVSLEEMYQAFINCNPEQRISFVRGWRRFVDTVFDGRMELNRIFGRNQM